MKKYVLFGSALFVLALAGCNTTKTAETEKPAPAKKKEYTRVTPTGSWITKKVKKQDAQTSESDTDQAQRAMSDMQRRGTSMPRDTGN
ncbi:MAG: hypothetical protein NDI75_12585 [Candidatus Didemnitutus sp.]|nr:hypothetical protein [Candidatus Didemnitutus sp.]